MVKTIKDAHKKCYKKAVQSLYFSPSCLNILGDHADISQTNMLALTLEFGHYAAVTRRDDSIVSVFDLDLDARAQTDLNSELALDAKPLAVFKSFITRLKHEGYNPHLGYNVTLHSSIIKNAGLSSTASLIALIALIVTHESKIDLPKARLIKYCQSVEEEQFDHAFKSFAYFPILLGKKNHAMLLNTHSLKTDYYPLNLEDFRFILFNSNKKRNFVENDMAERIQSVRKGIKLLTDKVRIEALANINLAEFNRIKGTIKDTKIMKRIEHIVFENERTNESVSFIEDDEYILLGDAMIQSHASLKELFEVTSAETDYIALELTKLDALGVKQTGLGFGGSVLALFEKTTDVSFDALEKMYEKRFKKELLVLTLTTSDGARILTK